MIVDLLRPDDSARNSCVQFKSALAALHCVGLISISFVGTCFGFVTYTFAVSIFLIDQF